MTVALLAAGPVWAGDAPKEPDGVQRSAGPTGTRREFNLIPIAGGDSDEHVSRGLTSVEEVVRTTEGALSGKAR